MSMKQFRGCETSVLWCESAQSGNKALNLSANLLVDHHLLSRGKTHDRKNKFTDKSTGVSFLCWVAGLSLGQG